MRRLLWLAVTAVVTFIALIVIENVTLAGYFPRLSRLTPDFSATYLRRELDALANEPHRIVVLGDSVLWGYGLKPNETAVAILNRHGNCCDNLSFKIGSPPNYYAIALLMKAKHIRPKAVILEVNQRVLNPADAAYSSLHPSIAALATPLLSPGDRRLLHVPGHNPTALEKAAESISLLYAMRSDVDETLYPQADLIPAAHPRAAAFEGEYDLTPLEEHNTGVYFLEKAAAVFQKEHIPVIAFMTPTNHALLHDYVDGPEYRSNVLFLQRVLRNRGAEVLDLDRGFPAQEFFDNVHLTAAGQRRLAAILGSALARPNHTFRE
ncbi:MAG TPA: hypothetical protein VFW34_06815 [Candidatus Rubrimentiphilum sp.]|nr:hypothetical protein [Candidatus Rubrimentiphilum sp.]